MNLKMYFCYESYTHLNSSKYFGSDLISVINFHVQIPVHLKLFYAFNWQNVWLTVFTEFGWKFHDEDTGVQVYENMLRIGFTCTLSIVFRTQDFEVVWWHSTSWCRYPPCCLTKVFCYTLSETFLTNDC